MNAKQRRVARRAEKRRKPPFLVEALGRTFAAREKGEAVPIQVKAVPVELRP